MYKSLPEIKSLIGTAVENFELDFKRGVELDKLDTGTSEEKQDTKFSIVKDCSAFANSGGGTIVYGIQEKKKGGISIASKIAPVTSPKISEDMLTQIIRSGLEPPLSKFTVTAIRIPRPKGTVFVVNVERGDTAHQHKGDRRYYRRVNATSDTMHDFEIRDVMNRRNRPVVIGGLDIRNSGKKSVMEKYIVPRLKVDGALTAKHWVFEILLPEDAAQLLNPNYIYERAADTRFPRYKVFEYSSDRAPATQNLILLPGQMMSLDGRIGFECLSLRITPSTFPYFQKNMPSIFWRLYVDNCPMKEGEIQFMKWFDF